MLHNEDDLLLLKDIVDSVLKILNTMKGLTFYHYERNYEKKSTIERQFEIIGLASHRISKETQELLNFIPWRQMIGLRNRIAHEYGEIKNSKIWNIAYESIPNLLIDLNKIDDIKDYIKTNIMKYKKLKDKYGGII